MKNLYCAVRVLYIRITFVWPGFPKKLQLHCHLANPKAIWRHFELIQLLFISSMFIRYIKVATTKHDERTKCFDDGKKMANGFSILCLLFWRNASETFQFHSNSNPKFNSKFDSNLTQIQFQTQILPPFSKRFLKVPKLSKNRQTIKQTQFKSSDDLVKSETNCSDVFLKKKIIHIDVY